MPQFSDTAPWRGFSRSDAFVLRAAAPTLASHAAIIEGDITGADTWVSQGTDGPLPLPARCDLRFLRVYVESISTPTPPSADLNAWITTDAAGDRGVTQKLTDVTWNVGMTSSNYGWAAVRLDIPYIRPADDEDNLYVWLHATSAAGLTCRAEIIWDADELSIAHAGQLRARNG